MGSSSGVDVVGGLAWERAGGPPLTFGQRLGVLGGAAGIVLSDLGQRILWRLSLTSRPSKVDLARWAPPDSRAAREADEHLRDVSSVEMAHHSFRTYYFSAIAYELSAAKRPIDREAFYVAAVMHDVGLFERERPEHEHCFTVASARAARRIATGAGWDEARQDRMALAITSNLNASVDIATFGAEAHFVRAGGGIEIMAQHWRVHADNLTEILARHPRDGFATNGLATVAREAERNPRGRFACLGPLFPFVVRRSSLRLEAALR